MPDTTLQGLSHLPPRSSHAKSTTQFRTLINAIYVAITASPLTFTFMNNREGPLAENRLQNQDPYWNSLTL
jgi:hypothetical protein